MAWEKSQNIIRSQRVCDPALQGATMVLKAAFKQREEVAQGVIGR